MAIFTFSDSRSFIMGRPGSTVVELLTSDPETKGSNPAANQH
jgi:hypothetical protein